MDNKKIGTLLYIEWTDAITDKDGWKNVYDAQEWGQNEDWVIKQVGFLLDETKEYLLLANQINPHSDFDSTVVNGLIKIPKTWIRKRIILSNVISF